MTPLDIHNKEFRKAFRGYEEQEVDEFLDLVVREYERLYKENIDLKEALAAKDSNIGQYKDLEDTLKKTLVVAQKTADDMKDNAVREAEVIVGEARLKAEKIILEAGEKARTALLDYENIRKQSLEFKVRFRTLLRSQLELVEESVDESTLAEEEAAAGHDFTIQD
ncbi:MAG TPA: DivIVA domain-containing protein [Desulfobacteria bacterium]|nr:DivIVA domain-containing protein [Desulfobacteria bacterium]